MDISELKGEFASKIEGKSLHDDIENWNACLASVNNNRYVSTAYKASTVEYQKAYFETSVEYFDCSSVLYRGGRPVGIWPVSLIREKNGNIVIGSNGSHIIEPLFTALPKAESQRSVIQNIIGALCEVAGMAGQQYITTQITILDEGSSQWQRKWMESGAKCINVTWCAFADLHLTIEEIQSRIRRTNKYSISKGKNEYDIKIYDSNDDLSYAFKEFHDLHTRISGRETRSQKTWDIEENSVRNNSIITGYDFLVFIRDKETGELAGAAAFICTPQTGIYSVAAYDRERFNKPVGHVVQAAAMDYMKGRGIRWYEIGERIYPSDIGSYEKLINIGNYKEGFATHMYPRITLQLDVNEYIRNC